MSPGAVTLGDVIGWIRDGGVIGLLVIIVWGALNEWWVTGRQYRRILHERDEFRTELFHSLGLSERATRSLDKATSFLGGELLDDATRLSRSRLEREIRRGLQANDDDG